MGRTASKPVTKEDITVETPALPTEQILQNQNLAAKVAEELTDERDLINQLLGQIQMASSFARFADVVSLSKLKHIKENKLYRALAGKKGVDPDGNEIADVGTFDGFCRALGLSRSKVDEDLVNLSIFGEHALKQLSSIGAGYRELRQFRKLPEDQKTALIEVAKSGDKESFVDLAEEIIAKHTKEKSALQAENTELKANLEARSKVLTDTNDKVAQLKTDLAKLQEQKRLIEPPTPDEQSKILCLEATRITTLIDGQLHGDLNAVCKALVEHTEQTGIDHQPFMTGLICQLELTLNQLRGTYYLDDEPSGDAMPTWLDGEEDGGQS